MTPVTFLPDAIEDIKHAYQWYEAEQRGLGSRFLDDIALSKKLISLNPTSYQYLFEPIRRAPLRQFRHTLYYMGKDNAVFVIGCLHARQTPDETKQRVFQP